MGAFTFLDMVEKGEIMSQFITPSFNDKFLEFKFENNEVCIYGTKEGLLKLSSLIEELANNPQKKHIHLEDYELLTDKSLQAVVAIFE